MHAAGRSTHRVAGTSSDMENPPDRAPEERDEHNRLGFYKADEDATYDERGGKQGEGEDADIEKRVVDEP